MAITLVAGLAAVGSSMIAAGGLISIGAAFGAFAIGAGLSLVSRALMPSPDLGTQMGGQSVMTREAAHSRKIIYGRARIGGNVVYLESTGSDNKYLYLVVAVAGHEIDAYESVWFNDKKVWDGGVYQSGWATAGNSSTSPYVDISFYKGDQTAADSGLVAASTKWTTNHKLLDTAYMVVKLTHDTDQFAQGLPNISTIIRGKKVLDPSNNSTAWSQNPALCVYDYLRDTKYGLSETAANILTASVTTAKGVCDEAITLSAGGTQPRYTIDGVVDTNNSIKANIETMVGSMAGRLVYSGGKFEVHAGEYIAPSITVDESQIVGEITVQTKQSRRNAFNGVKGVFLSEEDNYILADYPAQISAAYALQDGDPIYLDMALPYTSNNVRAQRLAKLALFRSRQQEAITIPCNLSALRFKIGDNISVTNTRLGYSGKVFEVVGYAMDFTSNGQIVVNVDAIETASSIWDWQASDEEVFLGGGEVELYDGSVSVAPTSINITSDSFLSDDGTFNSAFNVAWTDANDAFTDHYIVEWKLASASNYFSQSTKSTPFSIVNLQNNETYNVRVKAVNELGVSSAYLSASPTSAIDTTAPSAPTSVSAKDEFEQATISWVNPTVDDFSHVDVYGSNSSGSGFALIGTSAGTTFTEPELGTGVTRYYKLKAVDYTGNASGFSSVDGATTTQVPIGGIADDAVDTDQIADLAVETDQIDNDAVTIAKVAASLQSTNYVSGSAGWKILKSGVVEFEEATIRGSIIANDGEIGGFDIAGTYLKDAANTMGLSSVVSSADDVRFWAGNTFANRATAPFFVTKGGALKATKITVSGTAPLISIGTNSADTITLSTASDYRMWVGSSTPENAKFSVHKDGTLTAKGMHLQDGNANAYFSPQGFTDLAYSEIAANTASRVSKFESNLVYNLQSVKVTLIQSTSLTLGIKASNLFSGLDLSSVTIGSAQSMANALADIPDNFTLKIQKSTTSASSGFTDVVSQTYTKVTTGSSSATNYRATSTQFVPSGTTTFATPAEVDVSNHASVSGLDENGDRTLENTATYAQDVFWFRVQLTTTDTSYDTSLNNLATWPRSFLVEDNGSTGFNVISANEITQAAASGDITGVEAGTNLNGGGASGDVILNLDSTITGDHTFSNNLIIGGNLTVQGTTTTVDTDDLNVKDKNITLNYSTGDSSGNANGAGITIQDAVNSTTNATILWDSTNDKFDFSHKLTTPSLDVGGAIEFNSLSGTGSVSITDILDQDDMSSNSATALATQQSIKAYVLANVNSGSFLPLSGGVMTGAITSNSNFETSTDVKARVYYSKDTNNSYLSFPSTSQAVLNSSTSTLLAVGGATKLQVTATGTNVFAGTLSMGGQEIVSAARNLTNIGTISSGAITSSGLTLSSVGTAVTAPYNTVLWRDSSYNVDLIDQGWTAALGDYLVFNAGGSNPSVNVSHYLGQSYADFGGYVTAPLYKIGTTTVIDSGRALTNITGISMTGGSITSYGSVTAGQGGIYTGSTERITNAGNLTNIGTIASTSFIATNNGTNKFNVNIGGTTETWAANSRATLHLDGVSSSLLGFRHSGVDKGYLFSTGSTMELLSYGAVHLLSNSSGSYFGKLSAGVWNVSHGLQINGNTVIDSSRNLTNIGTIFSGAITSSGTVKGTIFTTDASNSTYFLKSRASSGTAISVEGTIFASGSFDGTAYKRGGTTFLDPSNNLTVSALNSGGTSSLSDGRVYVDTLPRGIAINYADSSAWVLDTNGFSSQTGYYGGSFTINGTQAENQIIHSTLPDGSRGLVWHTPSNDTANNADGGWNKAITGITDNNSYISVVYVRRNGASTNGTFYHGCNGSHTLNLSGTANTNPYFGNFGISALPQDVWCVSIGFIRANSDASTSNSAVGGVYRCDTGAKVSTHTDFKMKSGSTAQQHRTYLYYSTVSASSLSWAKPMFYVVDGSEPTLSSLIQPLAATGVGTTINNNADNRIITGSATANTLNAESGLTYDGTTLSGNAIQMSGNINASQVSANNVVGNVYKVGATTVINSSRNATFASVLSSTVQANATADATGLSLRSTYEVLSGEGWCTALYNYNENDGFLVLRRSSTSGTAYPHFHVSGYNNPGYAGYTNGDGMVTITRSTGTKSGSQTYAGSALSTGTDFSRWVKTTTETILYDNDSQHRIRGRLTVNGSSAVTGYPLHVGGTIASTTGYAVGTTQVIDASRNAYFATLNGAAIGSYWVNSGSWYGDLGSNGYTRQWGLSMTGGSEFVVLSKNGQGSLLVDGQYMSYESNNGFFGSYNSAYGNLTGIRATAANTLTVMQLDGGSANLASTGSVSGSSVSSTAGSITSYGALYAGQGGIYTNSVERISNAGNLTNIGTIASGAIASTGTISTTTGNYSTATSRNQFNTAYGYIQLGPMNTSWAHIYTDRPAFYTNKDIYVLSQKVLHAGNYAGYSTFSGAVSGASYNVGSTPVINSSRNLTNITSALINGPIGTNRASTNGAIWMSGGVDANHALWNDYYGGPTTKGAGNSGFDGIKWNTYRGIHIKGGTGGAHNIIVAENSSSNLNNHTVKLYASNVLRLSTTTSGVTIAGTLSGTAIQMSGDINAAGLSANNVAGNVFKIGTTTVIDASRNITNVGTIDTTGATNFVAKRNGVTFLEVVSGATYLKAGNSTTNCLTLQSGRTVAPILAIGSVNNFTDVIDASRNAFPQSVQFPNNNNGISSSLNDGALHVRAHADKYHKIWYYDGIAFATNEGHGHFRFYAESNTQRNSTTGGKTLIFDIDTQNRTVGSLGSFKISGSHSSSISTPNINSYGALSSGTAYNYHMVIKQADGTVRGQITNNVYGTQYTGASDYRLKENIQPLPSATNLTLALNPCTFNWIEDADNTVIQGFVAHEVQAIVPEAVVGEKDALDADGNPDYQTIDQSKLIPILVKTIQELEARITALESA